MSPKVSSPKDIPLPASSYNFVEHSQMPRIDRKKYDEAFDKAWSQIANQYQEDQIAIKKARRKYLIGALVGFLIGAALAIAGGVIVGTNSTALDSSTAFIILIVGCSATALSLFLGLYFFFKVPNTGTTQKTVKLFVDNFMSNYLISVTPDLVLRGIDLDNSKMNAQLGRSQCMTYATAMKNTSQEIDCGAMDYLFKTGDIAMMFGPGSFVRMEFKAKTRVDLEYKGKRIALHEASVVRIERRVVSNGKTTTVEYYPVVCFDGILLVTEYACGYPYPLDVVAGGAGLRSRGLSKPEYELASEEFNRELNLYVGKEDGVALRKAFQPRMIAQFCDLSGYKSFKLLRHKPGHTTAIYSSGSALGLSGYSKRLFFKSKKDAYEMVNRETVPFFQNFGDLISLVDCDFLQ